MPIPLLAHAFGSSYVLPLPLWLYLYAAAAAIVLSFIIIALIDRRNTVPAAPERTLFAAGHPRWPQHVAAALGLGVALLVIATGFFGRQMPLVNLSVTAFWIIVLLALTYLTALVDGLWPHLNPAATIYRWLQNVAPEAIAYPRRLGYWPAAAAYIGLIWLELLSHGFATVPRNLAAILTIYGVVMVFGQVVFGRDWLRYGDFFTVFLTQVGRVAPFVVGEGKLRLRRPFMALVGAAAPLSLVAFTIFMLASTAYDGFRETVAFGNAYSVIASALGAASPDIIQFIMLVGTWAFFVVLYLVCLLAMKSIADLHLPVAKLAGLFAASLIPIAVAYNAAHYYTLLATQGQAVIALASDPFGYGWDLFGTAGYRINIGIIPASFVWYSQVALILAGHIAGVYVAHRQALAAIPDTRKAILSQYPMLLLMVVFTCVSLWIIAQPLTLGR